MKDEGETQVLVGDQVEFEVHDDSTAVIRAVLPRRSLLVRRLPGKFKGSRGIAANVDQVVVVGAARQPDWEAPLIDRFLAVAEGNSIPAVVVVNKCDLLSSVDELAAPYKAAGYDVLRTSVIAGQGLESLATCLAGRTSLFTGPTGVGKSSLLNALQPGLSLRTGIVSPRTKAGRHTTVAAEMHRYGDAGFVVDTPGLRDIGVWGLDPADVAAAFPDISRLAAGCRFDNCRHLEEPNCAVISAARAGELATSRLASYQKLLAEATGSRPH
jgi:ribosome biogenesis GTPase